MKRREVISGFAAVPATALFDLKFTTTSDPGFDYLLEITHDNLVTGEVIRIAILPSGEVEIEGTADMSQASRVFWDALAAEAQRRHAAGELPDYSATDGMEDRRPTA